jgi:hypothetical protein
VTHCKKELSRHLCFETHQLIKLINTNHNQCPTNAQALVKASNDDEQKIKNINSTQKMR